jgi:hypothetical protein
LRVLGRVYAQSRGSCDWEVLDRNEVNTRSLSAVDAEVVYLAAVVALVDLRVRMVCVAAARVEMNGSSLKSTRLALNAIKTVPVVKNQVASCVLTEREINAKAAALQNEHDG